MHIKAHKQIKAYSIMHETLTAYITHCWLCACANVHKYYKTEKLSQALFSAGASRYVPFCKRNGSYTRTLEASR